MKAKKKGSRTKSGVPRKLRQMLNIRMLKEGWTSITQFKKGAGVPFSVETIRRAFVACDYKNLDTITLAIIMKHLRYSQMEIKKILTRHLGLSDPALQMIGDSTESDLSNAEESLVEAYRILVDLDPQLSNSLADYLDLLGMAYDVPTRRNTDALRPQKASKIINPNRDQAEQPKVEVTNKYESMTRYELAAARTQVWKDGDDPEEQAKIEKAFSALDRRDRVLAQRSLKPEHRNLAMCK